MGGVACHNKGWGRGLYPISVSVVAPAFAHAHTQMHGRTPAGKPRMRKPWRAVCAPGMDAVREHDRRMQAGGLLMLALSAARYVCVYERLVEAGRSDSGCATCREGAHDIMPKGRMTSCRRGA